MLKKRAAVLIAAVAALPAFFLLGAIVGTDSSGRDIVNECRKHSFFKHVEHDSEVEFACQEIKNPVVRL